MLAIIFAFLLTATANAAIKCTETPCRLSENTLKFFAFGDWGGMPVWPYYTHAQTVVAKTLGNMAGAHETHFQLVLGDNFYLTGVKNANDKRFQKTFENIYTDKALFTPWYLLAGNHDHYGNVTGEVAYTDKSARWVFPSLHYTIQYELSDGTSVEFVMIDTVTLCGKSKDIEFASFIRYFMSASTEQLEPADPQLANSQLEWIENTLKASKADYLFVAGHYPVYSIAEHGPSQCLIERLYPLLTKYKVSAYISGHDHTLQHLQVETKDESPINFVVSGAAATVLQSTKHIKDVPKDSLKFHYPSKSSWNPFARLGFTSGGFVYAELDSDRTKFSYIRGDGQTLYDFDLKPRT